MERSGWAKGTTVHVYIYPSITGDARRATEDAFRNWNTANQTNNSSVNYVFIPNPPISGDTNFLIVNLSTNLRDPTSNVQIRALTKCSDFINLMDGKVDKLYRFRHYYPSNLRGQSTSVDSTDIVG